MKLLSCLLTLPSLGIASLLLIATGGCVPDPTALGLTDKSPASVGLIAAQALFVDPKGSDTNDGRSPEKAFATVQRAANVAQPGDTIYLRAGTYRESVRPARSGTTDKPITYTSYPGERAQINGTDLITSSWKASGSVYTTRLKGHYESAHNFAPQVFVDGQMMQLARWPNGTSDVSLPVKSAITTFVSKDRDKTANLTTGVVEDDALAVAKIDAVDAEIFFQPNSVAWSWAFSGKVTKQENGRLTFTSRSDSGKDGGKGYPVGSRYFLFNSRALLDAPGEWYLDERANELSLIMPASEAPTGHRVEIRRRDWAFDLDDRRHIVIRDLDLFACSITTDRAAGGDGRGYDSQGNARYPWRAKKEGLASASDILITGLRAEYLSHFTDVSGHFFLQWGQGSGIVLSGTRLTLRDSVLRFSAGNGVTVLGRGNRVLNNLILDTDYSGVDCAAINTGGVALTEDHEFAYNTIARTGRSGITPRGLANSNPTNLVTRIHHNDIFHCMLQDWDGGGLYVAACDGKFVRVDHNLVHDIDGFNTSGLYPDFSKNYIFDHNVIWNTEWGFQLQGAYGEDGRSAEMNSPNNTLCYHNTIVITNTSGAPYGPFGFAGSKGQNIGTVLANNIIVIRQPTPGWQPYAGAYAAAEITNNLVWAGDLNNPNNPRFADMNSSDFTLQSGSPAIGKATPLIALQRDGITVPPFADDTPVNPDLGAFASGAAVWQAGCNLPERKALAPWSPVKTHGKLR